MVKLTKKQLMLTQFRIRYPQGSLISELVEIDRGKYIVKASVAINGITLASGMAAAETVEEAEDRARQRALAILALDEVPQQSLKSAKPEPNLTAASAEDNNNNNFSSDFLSTAGNGVENTAATVPNAFSEPISSHAAVSKVEAEQLTLTNSLPLQADLNSVAHVESENLNTEIKAADAEELKEVEQEAEPVHIDDIIKQTDFEIKRLGWTKEQGRNYLIANYGKRSRHLLEDHELWEFLEHLKAQPSRQ